MKALIEFASDSYDSARGIEGVQSPGFGKGIGLAFGLWGLQLVFTITYHQVFYRAMSTGVWARGALIASVFRKSLKLKKPEKGRLVNTISTDVSRIDQCCEYFHVCFAPLFSLPSITDSLNFPQLSWTAIVEMGVIIGILIANLGVSSLVGVAVYAAGELQNNTGGRAWKLTRAYDT